MAGLPVKWMALAVCTLGADVVGELGRVRAEPGPGRLGDPAAALPCLERAARRGDPSADVLVLLARVHLKLAARTDAGVRAAHLDDARAGLTLAAIADEMRRKPPDGTDE